MKLNYVAHKSFITNQVSKLYKNDVRSTDFARCLKWPMALHHFICKSYYYNVYNSSQDILYKTLTIIQYHFHELTLTLILFLPSTLREWNSLNQNTTDCAILGRFKRKLDASVNHLIIYFDNVQTSRANSSHPLKA